MLQTQGRARAAVAADLGEGRVVGVDGDRVDLGGLVEDLVDVVAAEGAALAGRQAAFAVDVVGEFEGLPAVGGQSGGEGVLLELAGGRDEGADRLGVVVPAGAGAGRPADQPGLAAARPLQPYPGAAFGVERERVD